MWVLPRATHEILFPCLPVDVTVSYAEDNTIYHSVVSVVSILTRIQTEQMAGKMF